MSVCSAVLLLGALVAAGPGSTAEKAKERAAPARRPAERPDAVLVAPSPAAVLPELAALVHLSPRLGRELTRLSKLLGFDPLDPAALAVNGVDPAAPIYVWAPAPRAPLVAELTLGRPELADQALAALAAKKKACTKLPDGIDGSGVFTGPADHPELVLLRRGNRLFVQAAHPRSTPSGVPDELPAIESAAIGHKPKRAPAGLGLDAPNLWLVASGGEHVERIEGAAKLARGRLDVALRGWLGMAAGLIAGDLAGTGRPGRRLLDGVLPALAGTETAVELVARVGAAGLAESLDLAALGADKANIASGEVHAVLTPGGSVLIALGMRDGAPPAKVELFSRLLAERAEGASVRVIEHGTGRVVTALFGAKDGADLERLTSAEPERTAVKPARPPPARGIELDLAPQRLFGALGERAAARDALRVSRSRIMALELELGAVAARMKGAKLAISVPAGTVEASGTLEWEPTPR